MTSAAPRLAGGCAELGRRLVRNPQPAAHAAERVQHLTAGLRSNAGQVEQHAGVQHHQTLPEEPGIAQATPPPTEPPDGDRL